MNKIIILCAAFILTACTNLSDARMAQGTGMTRSYNASFDETWEAVKCSCNALGLPIAGENKTDGYILAQRGITAFSYGENVAIFIKKQNTNKTNVEVVSKKALQTTIFAPDWSPKILDGVNSCL